MRHNAVFYVKNKGFNMSSIRGTIKVLLVFFLGQYALFSEDLWSHISETTAGNGYSKKVLNLALQLNYIQYNPALEVNKSRALVLLTETGNRDRYSKLIEEKFNSGIAIINYKFDFKSRDQLTGDKESYNKLRIKQYLKHGSLLHMWPPIYPETAEIRKELDSKGYEQRYLLLTGNQSNILNHSALLSSFNRIILVSPDANLEDSEQKFWQGKDILWIGASYEKLKLEKLQTRYGGKILVYERSSVGARLLMRNEKVLGDILSWLNG